VNGGCGARNAERGARKLFRARRDRRRGRRTRSARCCCAPKVQRCNSQGQRPWSVSRKIRRQPQRGALRHFVLTRCDLSPRACAGTTQLRCSTHRPRCSSPPSRTTGPAVSHATRRWAKNQGFQRSRRRFFQRSMFRTSMESWSIALDRSSGAIANTNVSSGDPKFRVSFNTKQLRCLVVPRPSPNRRRLATRSVQRPATRRAAAPARLGYNRGMAKPFQFTDIRSLLLNTHATRWWSVVALTLVGGTISWVYAISPIGYVNVGLNAILCALAVYIACRGPRKKSPMPKD
jgi:hypothetical protein